MREIKLVIPHTNRPLVEAEFDHHIGTRKYIEDRSRRKYKIITHNFGGSDQEATLVTSWVRDKNYHRTH